MFTKGFEFFSLVSFIPWTTVGTGVEIKVCVKFRVRITISVVLMRLECNLKAPEDQAMGFRL